MGSCFRSRKKNSYTVTQMDEEYSSGSGKFRSNSDKRYNAEGGKKQSKHSTTVQNTNNADIEFKTRQINTQENGYDTPKVTQPEIILTKTVSTVVTASPEPRPDSQADLYENVQVTNDISDHTEDRIVAEHPEVHIEEHVEIKEEPTGRTSPEDIHVETFTSQDNYEEPNVYAEVVANEDLPPPPPAETIYYDEHHEHQDPPSGVNMTYAEAEMTLSESQHHDSDQDSHKSDDVVPEARVTFSPEVQFNDESDHSYRDEDAERHEYAMPSATYNDINDDIHGTSSSFTVTTVSTSPEAPIEYRDESGHDSHNLEAHYDEVQITDSPAGTWDARLNTDVCAELDEVRRSLSSSKASSTASLDTADKTETVQYTHSDPVEYNHDAPSGVSVVTVTNTTYTNQDAPGENQYYQADNFEGHDNERNEKMVSFAVENGDYEMAGHNPGVDGEVTVTDKYNYDEPSQFFQSSEIHDHHDHHNDHHEHHDNHHDHNDHHDEVY